MYLFSNEMNGLKVRPCCIEVLEQVLNILKKHVSNDEKETELQSNFKCDTLPVPPLLPTKPVAAQLPSQLHYIGQNQNISSGQSILNACKSSASGSSSNSIITVRPQTSKNTVPLGYHFDNHSQQNVIHTAPSAPSTIRNRIPVPAKQTPAKPIPAKPAPAKPAPQNSPPQSMVVITNPHTKPSNQALNGTVPSSSAVAPPAPTYRQTQPTQTFQDTTIMNLLREESSSRNKFLLDNQISSTSRKVLAIPKNMEGNTQKEVELVPGSGVKIPESELIRIQFNATSANDPAVLVIALLQHFFSDEVLAQSTATSCRGKGRAKHSTAKPLNQRIMQAIRQFSTSYSEKINRSISETQVNRITANKIGTAKMALKRRQEDNSLSLHSLNRNKVKRHSSTSSSLNADEILNFSDEQLNFVIKVENEEFYQPLT